MSEIYRHYGNDHFDKTLVKPIQNRDTWGKPAGGFWASRLNAKVSWKDWCIQEDFETQRLSKHFDFTLKDDANILVITNQSDYKTLLKEHSDWFVKPRWDFIDKPYLDFEKLSKMFDGIEVYAGSDNELYFDFYGWDCDSIVIFNNEKIVPLEGK